MKEGIKVVDKYELLDQKTQIRDGIKIILARHTVEDKMYTLKKLKLDDQNKNNYFALINQINILKQLRDERVIVCHKLFKTNTSIYVTYDYISENTLQSFIKAHRSSLGYKQKLKIATKLVQFFSFLKRSNIVNLNIKPNNIQVLHKNQQMYLKFNDFIKPISQVIVENVPVSEFVPLEIFHKEIHLNHSCSIYTLGKLFEFIELNKENSNNPNKNNYKFKQSRAFLISVIQKMVSEKQAKRPNLDEIVDLLTDLDDEHSLNNTMKSQKCLNDLLLSSRSNQNLGINKAKSFEGLSSASKSTKNNFSEQLQKQSKNRFNQYCLMIIKARNLSLFLLKCCQVCLKVDFVQMDRIVETSFLYLKKSTSIMNQLYKFMSNGRHKQIIIPTKQFTYFYKSTDYFRLQTIISKDLNFSKKYLNQMLTNILHNYSNLLQCSKFKKETSHQQVENKFMKIRTIQLLKTIIQNARMKSIPKQALKYFHILSYLINFDSFEEMFKQLINQQILQLERQTLFINSAQMNHEELILKLPQIDKYLQESTVEH